MKTINKLNNPESIGKVFKMLNELANPKVLECLDIIVKNPKINRTDIAIEMRENDPNRVGKFTKALLNAGLIKRKTLKGTNYVQHTAQINRILKINKSIKCIL